MEGPCSFQTNFQFRLPILQNGHMVSWVGVGAISRLHHSRTHFSPVLAFFSSPKRASSIHRGEYAMLVQETLGHTSESAVCSYSMCS